MEGKDQKDTCQNRLLFATAVLAFLYYAEAEFVGISFAGTTVNFKNQNAVNEFTWAIWFYYYFRTYQYYREAGIDNFRKALNKIYVTELGHLLLGTTKADYALVPDDDSIKSSIVRLKFGSLPLEDRSDDLLRRASTRRPRKRYKKQSPFQMNLLWSESGFRKKRHLPRFLGWVSGLSFLAVVYPPSDRYRLQGQTKNFVRLPASAALKIGLIYFTLFFRKPQFLENQGPLILGLIPVWQVIGANWQNIWTLP